MSKPYRLTRRDTLKAIGCASAGALLPSGCGDSDPGPDGNTPAEGPPNILYLYSDQHRGDALGSLGDPVLQTPNLDSLAAEGVTFPRCYTNAPLCRPGRACMMTGLYPNDHGVWSNNVVTSPDGPSHARRLRDEAGYLTAVIGKTHLHDHQGHLDGAAELLRRWGFEQSTELTGPTESTTLPSAWTDAIGADKYERFKAYIDNYRDNYFDHDHGLLPPPDDSPWNLGTEDHLDVFCALTAAEWIRNAPTDRPFYLQVGFPGPHPPFDATREWRQHYPIDDPRIPAGVGVGPPLPTPELFLAVQAYFGGPQNEAEARAIRALYYAKLTMIDHMIGDILAALAERGLLERTWIIYGADHGEMAGDHGLVGKIVFYEGSIGIPLIVRPPRGVAGWASSALSDQLDVTASILAIGGLDPGPGDGQSLVQLVEAGPEHAGAHTGKEQVFSQVSADDATRYSMVRTDRYKLVAGGTTATELYDLQEDPAEFSNRVDDPALTTVKRDLGDRLRARFLG